MRHDLLRIFFCGAVIFLLSGCAGDSNNFAPITNGWSTSQASRFYRVQPDDTVYSIAFRFGTDYRKLAELNHLSAPYQLVPGQNLLLSSESAEGQEGVITSGAPEAVMSSTVVTPVKSMAETAPVRIPEVNPVASNINNTKINNKPAVKITPLQSSSPWLWPAQGKVIHGFSAAYGGNKGIDIAGNLGDPVMAAAAGKVVYCGTGLKRYGLLIIIEHNTEYLSAYAHNSKALVKEGQLVKAGEKIALMGSSGASSVALHFEIRKAGKSVDPLLLLPSR